MAFYNPWSTKKVASKDTPATPIAETPDYPGMAVSDYAVPSLQEGAPYNDEFGWGRRPEGLLPSAVDYPAAQRLQLIPRKDFFPEPEKPAEQGFYPSRDRDDKERHSVEFQDADGWQEAKGVYPTDLRWADDPKRKPPSEHRPTMQMAPRTYLFERPFAQESRRTLTGNHFSMADHRRNYEILHAYGMAPVRSARNTYRLEPTPWDENIVDLPPPAQQPYARTVGQTLPSAPRTWRLS